MPQAFPWASVTKDSPLAKFPRSHITSPHPIFTTKHNAALLLQAVLTAAVEGGIDQVLTTPDAADLVQQWQQLATFSALELQADGKIINKQAQQVSLA
jgi:hypothetical protein